MARAVRPGEFECPFQTFNQSSCLCFVFRRREKYRDGCRRAAQHREHRDQRWLEVPHVGAEGNLDAGHLNPRGGTAGDGPGRTCVPLEQVGVASTANRCRVKGRGLRVLANRALAVPQVIRGRDWPIGDDLQQRSVLVPGGTSYANKRDGQ